MLVAAAVLRRLPAPLHIPVHTMSEISEDIYLRAFDKCPAFSISEATLSRNTEWAAKETERASFLRQLAGIPHFHTYSNSQGIVPLLRLFDVYDELNSALYECECEHDVTLTDCFDQTFSFLMSHDVWKELEELAFYSELFKYAQGAGEMLGGAQVRRMAQRMRGPKKLYVYTGHHQSLLAVMAALGFVPDQVPNFGHALVFELYQDRDTNFEYIKIGYKGGRSSDDFDSVGADAAGNSDALEYIQFPNACDGNLACQGVDNSNLEIMPYIVFHEMIKLASIEEWCKACRNDVTGVCRAAMYDEKIMTFQTLPPAPAPIAPPTMAPTDQVSSSSSNTNSDSHANSQHPTSTLVGALVGGICLGMLGLVILAPVVHRVKYNIEEQIEAGRVQQREKELFESDNIIEFDEDNRSIAGLFFTKNDLI